MRGGAIFAAVIATLFALFGLIDLSQATRGVGLIAFACFVAIGARLMQASSHQRTIEAFLTPKPQRPPPPENPPYVRPENIEQVAKQYGVSTRP